MSMPTHPTRPIFKGYRGHQPGMQKILHHFKEPTVSGRALAVAVFRAASCWSEVYIAPTETHIRAWAQILDKDWLTLDLAERAVHEFFAQSITGFMVPMHVLVGASVLRLETEAQPH